VSLVTRAEAAEFCRCSLETFDKHVRPHLSELLVGRSVFFRRQDLWFWANTPDGPAPASKPALQLDDEDRRELRRMLTRQRRVAAGLATADEIELVRLLGPRRT
jgi:hypothetical protein